MKELENYQTAFEKMCEVLEEVRKVVHGKDECVEKALAAILARGHILIEDVPGVGKTTLAVAFSKVMALDNRRVQFTPDVLPSDVTGFTLFDQSANAFTFFLVSSSALSRTFLQDAM